MYPTFERRTVDYTAAYTAWLNWGVPEQRDAYRAMARNMMHDHRVAELRETSFHAGYGSRLALEEALGSYHWDRIRFATTPDFLDRDLSKPNLVAGAPGANLIDQDTPLVTFLDLNGLGAVYAWARLHPPADFPAVFEDFPRLSTDEAIATWLSDLVRMRGKATVVGAVLAAKQAYRADLKNKPFHPVWAGLWDELKGQVATAGPDRWLESVGVWKGASGRWIVPLCYSAFDAGTLVRPTVLDSGFYAHHFPSPPPPAPAVELRHGGCCMDLRISPPATGLVHEYIHQVMDFEPRHWERAGAKCEPTLRAGPPGLVSQRRAHHRLLCTRCGAQVNDWIRDSEID